jgi:hypothetical protein
MSVTSDIIVVPVALLFYGSGLLLWPVRRWLRRKQPVRGKALGFVFLGQIIAYLATIIVGLIRPRIFEHGYYWFIVVIELNIVFTVLGVIAWLRDAAFEESLDFNAAERPTDSAS